MVNPLDGVVKVWEEAGTSPMYEYLVKGMECCNFVGLAYLLVVPTAYTGSDGLTIATNQFSATEYTQSVKLHSFNSRGVPGTFLVQSRLCSLASRLFYHV